MVGLAFRDKQTRMMIVQIRVDSHGISKSRETAQNWVKIVLIPGVFVLVTHVTNVTIYMSG